MHKPAFLALLALVALHPAWAQEAVEPEAPVGPTGIAIAGMVLWPDHDLSSTYVKVYSDASWKQLVAEYPTGGPTGGVGILLDEGTYYLMAFSDQDHDSRLSPGDGLGFYGVTSMRGRPMPLVLDQSSAGLSVTITIVGQLDAEMKLQPTSTQVEAYDPGDWDASIGGRVTSAEPAAGRRFVILMPVTPLLQPRAAQVAQDGSFALPVARGPYQLLATEVRGSGRWIGEGDLVGLHGYEAAMGPSLPRLELGAGQAETDLDIRLDWVIGEHGQLSLREGGAKGPRLVVGMLPGIVTGTITRSGESIPGIAVKAYADEALTKLRAHTISDAAGQFTLGLVAGTYYLVAVRDVNSDGALSPGDEMGFLGLSADKPSTGPQRIPLDPGQVLGGADIALLMALDADSHPQPLPEEAAEVAGPPVPR